MGEILITGASGVVGSELVRVFSRENKSAAAAVTKAEREFPAGIEGRHLDFTDRKSYAAALDGVSRVFLLRPPAISNVGRDIFPFLAYCRDIGVEQIVLLSILGAENAGFLPHRKIELEIIRLELPYTFLRPSYFMQNFSTVHREEIKSENRIAVPAGSGKTSFVDVRDVAGAAFQAFFEPSMLNRSFDLTGSEALTYYQAADIFSRVLGRKIVYQNPSVFSFLFQQYRKSRNLPLSLVMTMIYTTARFGKAERVTNDVSMLLAREPITLARFVEDYQHLWR